MTVAGSGEGTNHYECGNCGEPCDIYVKPEQKPECKHEWHYANMYGHLYDKNESNYYVVLYCRHCSKVKTTKI
jgi:hypothetical protein